jgi:regulator of RNase E activity RraA
MGINTKLQSAMDIEMLAGYAEIDTASLSDALDSLGISGGLLGICPQVPGTRCAGFAYTVQYQPVSDSQGFKNAANYIDDVPPGSIIVSSNDGRSDCTVWGDILTTVAAGKKINGTVIDGAARDLDAIQALNYPLFSRAVFMQSGKNRVQLSGTQIPVVISGVTIHSGDLIVCDGNGCVAIPRDLISEVYIRALNIDQTERRIIAAVQGGESLAEARQRHRYDQPWIAS